MSNEQTKTQGQNVVAYQKRVSKLKENILYVCEKNMDNTLWVLRRWLRDEMNLVNKKDVAD